MKGETMIDEMSIISIIVSAGGAQSLMQQAFLESMNENFKEAEKLLEQANEELSNAHQAQTDLLQAEAAGENSKVCLLMVHAQDHLMNAILSKQLIANQIELQKQIIELKIELKEKKS